MLRYPILAMMLGLTLAVLASACGNDEGATATRPGDLDRTFGGDGIVTTAFPSFAFLNAVAIAPNGDVVAGGSTQPVLAGPNHFALARYRPDGTLDDRFGEHGTVVSEIGSISTIFDVAVLPDGNIIAAGVSVQGDDGPLTIVRYRPDGRVDETFGRDGITTTALPGVLAARIVHPLQSDTILVGAVVVVEGGYAVVVARYLANGTPDTRFGTDGVTVVPLPGSPGGIATTVAADGALLIAAPVALDPFGFKLALVRFDPNGRLDPSYGDGGRILVDSADFPVVLGFQPDGSLLTSDPDGIGNTLVRYRPDGTRDDGYHAARIDGLPIEAATDGAGNVVVASGVGEAVLVVRLAPTGDLDATFGDGGAVTTLPPGGIYPGRLLLQPNGRMLVVGTTRQEPSQFVLLRYLD